MAIFNKHTLETELPVEKEWAEVPALLWLSFVRPQRDEAGVLPACFILGFCCTNFYFPIGVTDFKKNTFMMEK